jgi:hypothetical protein
MPTISGGSIEFLLANNITLRDRNMMLLTHLQRLIEQKNIGELKGLMIQMNQTPEIHVSLLKCVEIMTEHVPEVQEIRLKTEEIRKQKMVS